MQYILFIFSPMPPSNSFQIFPYCLPTFYTLSLKKIIIHWVLFLLPIHSWVTAGAWPVYYKPHLRLSSPRGHPLVSGSSARAGDLWTTLGMLTAMILYRSYDKNSSNCEFTGSVVLSCLAGPVLLQSSLSSASLSFPLLHNGPWALLGVDMV